MTDSPRLGSHPIPYQLRMRGLDNQDMDPILDVRGVIKNDSLNHLYAMSLSLLWDCTFLPNILLLSFLCQNILSGHVISSTAPKVAQASKWLLSRPCAIVRVQPSASGGFLR